MSTIDLAGVSLDLWEGGEGPPLLFLHGAGGFDADHPFRSLLGRHRRITAPSHPGFGMSSLPEWIDRPEDIAHVYLGLLDRMGSRPVDLIACSLGGWIGAELTSMVPEKFRRLIFVGPVPATHSISRTFSRCPRRRWRNSCIISRRNSERIRQG